VNEVCLVAFVLLLPLKSNKEFASLEKKILICLIRFGGRRSLKKQNSPLLPMQRVCVELIAFSSRTP